MREESFLITNNHRAWRVGKFKYKGNEEKQGVCF